MTINTIQTPIAGYEAKRLEQLEPQRQDAPRTATSRGTGAGRLSLSREGRITAGMLKTAQDSEGVRPDKVAEVKARLSAGTYKVDSQDVASKLVRQELDVWG